MEILMYAIFEDTSANHSHHVGCKRCNGKCLMPLFMVPGEIARQQLPGCRRCIGYIVKQQCFDDSCDRCRDADHVLFVGRVHPDDHSFDGCQNCNNHFVYKFPKVERLETSFSEEDLVFPDETTKDDQPASGDEAESESTDQEDRSDDEYEIPALVEASSDDDSDDMPALEANLISPFSRNEMLPPLTKTVLLNQT